MKYLFRFVWWSSWLVVGLAFILPISTLMHLVILPLWHLRWPTFPRSSDDMPGWHDLLVEFPVEIWQHITGTYKARP